MRGTVGGVFCGQVENCDNRLGVRSRSDNRPRGGGGGEKAEGGHIKGRPFPLLPLPLPFLCPILRLSFPFSAAHFALLPPPRSNPPSYLVGGGELSAELVRAVGEAVGGGLQEPLAQEAVAGGRVPRGKKARDQVRHVGVFQEADLRLGIIF